MQQPDLLTVFLLPLEQGGFEYMVTGSVASTLYGEPRLTHDIDLVLLLKVGDIARFRSCFPDSGYYCPPVDIIRIELKRTTFSHFNLIHHDSGYKADCYPFTGDQLHAWALRNRRSIPIDDNFSIQVAPPEYVIIRKLQYYREGAAEKHLSDIRKMVSSPGTTIDDTVVKEWVGRLQLEQQWAKIGIAG